MISLIVAVDKNGCIGLNGKMPWNIPEEMKHFREYTWGKSVLVGRKTFEGFKQPLCNRYHYILSSKEYFGENLEVISNLENLIEKYKNSEEELVVIGGSKVYNYFLNVVDKMVISVIQNEYHGDTYFPGFDITKFKLESIQYHKEFNVYTLIRKEN